MGMGKLEPIWSVERMFTEYSLIVNMGNQMSYSKSDIF